MNHLLNVSSGLCVNCGGKGSGKPGPCPAAGHKGPIRAAVRLYLKAKQSKHSFDFYKAVDKVIGTLKKVPKADLLKAAKTFGVHVAKSASSKSITEQIGRSIKGRHENATRTGR